MIRDRVRWLRPRGFGRVRWLRSPEPAPCSFGTFRCARTRFTGQVVQGAGVGCAARRALVAPAAGRGFAAQQCGDGYAGLWAPHGEAHARPTLGRRLGFRASATPCITHGTSSPSRAYQSPHCYGAKPASGTTPWRELAAAAAPSASRCRRTCTSRARRAPSGAPHAPGMHPRQRTDARLRPPVNNRRQGCYRPHRPRPRPSTTDHRPPTTTTDARSDALDPHRLDLRLRAKDMDRREPLPGQ